MVNRLLQPVRKATPWVMPIAALLIASSTWAADRDTPPPTHIENFRLLDQFGNSHELYSYGSLYKGVLLYTQGNGCPINRQSYPKMIELRKKFEEQGIKFFFFNANPQDMREDVYEELTEFGLSMPCLLDPDQIVIGTLGSARTCEAILLDTKTWEVIYRGAVDDRYDYVGRKEIPDNDYLHDAMTAFLAGEPVSAEHSETKGCLINIYDLPQNVSYTEDVAPLLASKCTTCHREGGSATFALDSYAAAKEKAADIRSALLRGTMPPWSADVEIGQFANDHSLDYDQKRTIVSWVNAGANREGGDDPLRDIGKADPPTWYLGKPDKVFEATPESGGEVFSYVEIDPKLDKDIWIRASEVLPETSAAGGMVMAFAISPNQEAKLLAAHRPGEVPVACPHGTGIKIEAGSHFYLRVPSKSEGGARLGLYLLDEKPAYEVTIAGDAEQDITISAGEMNAEFTVERTIDSDQVLYALAPYMHGRGYAAKVEATFPDGETETLLSVPDYNSAWPGIYWLQRPRTLAKGTVVKTTAAFDNSSRNPENPDPTRAVSFGIDENQEVFAAFMVLAPVAIEGAD